MATINEEALEDLNVSIQVLMPEMPDRRANASVMISPINIIPTGIGGFVAFDEEHTGDVLGRRIEASVQIIIQSNIPGALREAAASVQSSFLGAERKKLLDLGILSIRQVASSFKRGAGTSREIDFVYNILFEYLKTPEEAEEKIELIPINIDLD
jgi:hypothetical protein